MPDRPAGRVKAAPHRLQLHCLARVGGNPAGRTSALTRCATLLAALALSFALVFEADLDNAGAANVTPASLRAQAAAISARISSDNARLAVISQHYLDEDRRLNNARTQERFLGAKIGALRASIGADQVALRTEAIAAYVHDGSGDAFGLILAGSPRQIAAGDAYLRVASGQLDQTAVTLGESLRLLQASLLAEQQAVATASTALAQASTDRGQALGAVSSEQSLYGSVHGQLSALVAAQQAASEAAAEAAAAATALASPVAAQPAGPPAPAGITAVPVSPGPIPAGSLAHDFLGVRNCESGNRYDLDTGNGYYGAYQFSYGTWLGLGGSGLASQASPATQDAAAYRLYQSSGWAAWPECAAILGL